MANDKKILLVGETAKVKEFDQALRRAGATVTIAVDTKQALKRLEAERPDGIVFVVPVYWESVADFVTKVRGQTAFVTLPIIYLGDFIEANDQVMLKRQGVHTLTLGPVPTEEAVRYVFSVI